MAGTFVPTSRPTQPGEYTDFIAQTEPAINVSAGSIVAIGGTHSWGVYNTPTLCTSYNDFVSKFGPGDTDLRRAVLQAFIGEGVVGKGGAGAVQVIRMALAGGIAAATHSLQNATPAAALTLTGKYPGTYGNTISVTVQAGAVSGTQQLVVLVGGAVAERYTFPSTGSTMLAGLAAQVNLVSAYVTATVVIDGVALTNVSNVSLTGGTDGASLTGADYTSAFNSLTNASFRVCAFSNLTDPTITASAVAWQQTLNTSGHRFTLVIGGAIAESVATAEAAASAINDHNTVRIGVGTITDLGNITPAVSTNLSTAQFAPRVAGVIAARGEKRDLVMARFAGVALNADAPGSSDINAAPTSGLTVFSADSREDAPVRIAQGCTTFTTPTAAADQRNPALYNGINVYGVQKYVSIMQGFEMDLQAIQEQTDGNIGDLNVNDRTRSYLVGEGRTLAALRVSAGIIQPNPTVVVDTQTFGPPSDDQDFVPIAYGFKFSPSLRQVFNSVAVAV